MPPCVTTPTAAVIGQLARDLDHLRRRGKLGRELLHVVGHVGVGSHGALLDGYAAVRGGPDVEPAQLPLDVFLRHLEEVSSQLLGLGPDGRRRAWPTAASA